jgi:syntaxin 18
MANITAAFNTALRANNAPPVTSHRYSIERLDEFLKEAYSIVCQSPVHEMHIA